MSVKCLNCKKETENKKFCNSSCSASYTNIGNKKNLKHGRNTLKKCLMCEEKTKNEKYCSMECSNKDKDIFKKEISELRTDRSRRKWLILHFGRECSKCKKKTWNGKEIPIELEHIDGNPENNEAENLCLLCPNCHAQTDTYKGKNVGKVKNTKRKTTMKKYYKKYR